MSERRAYDVPGIVGAVVFIAIGALALYHSREFTPLGAVFPRTMAIAMMLLSVVYIAMVLLRPTGAPPAPGGSNFRRAALVAVMVAWSLALERVGFLTTSVVAYALIMLIANYDRWTPARAVGHVAAGAIVLGSLYAIFRFVLQVPLPPGFFL